MSHAPKRSWLFMIEAELSHGQASEFADLLADWAFDHEPSGADFSVSMEPAPDASEQIEPSTLSAYAVERLRSADAPRMKWISDREYVIVDEQDEAQR